MPARHVVVDGSNIATEGRSLPSLAQLEEAVCEYTREFSDDVVTVVVDATFGHRIDESERAAFDEAVATNQIVSPPAGAIGRGDAFLLRIADKVGATVLSNDSFQEFHGEHEWLFHNGRLIGGKPVPGVGWIFTPRTPVRGPRSRQAVRALKSAVKKEKPDEQEKVKKAIAVATEEVVAPDSPSVKRRRRRRAGTPPAEPVNEPLTFIEFVAGHRPGSEVEAEVETFSSHGAFVTADGARCYIPLSGLGNPPPRAAREVLRKGERRQFVVQALDPPRRGIELALPEFAHVSGAPTPETVEEEIKEGAAARRQASTRPAAKDGRRRGPRRPAEGSSSPETAMPLPVEVGVAEPAEGGAPAAGAGMAPEPPGAASGEEPEPGRRTRRGPRRRAGAGAAAGGDDGAAEVAAAATGPAPATPAAPGGEPDGGEPDAPAPRRPPRSRKAADGQARVPAAPAAEEPAPAPSRARKAAKKAAQAAQATKAANGQARASAPPAAEEPVPAPSRAVKAAKKAAQATKAANGQARAPAPPAAEEPAPAPSRARKAAKKAAKSPAPVGEGPTPARPGKATGRRAGKTPAPVAEPGPEQADEPGSARRRPRSNPSRTSGRRRTEGPG